MDTIEEAIVKREAAGLPTGIPSKAEQEAKPVEDATVVKDATAEPSKKETVEDIVSNILKPKEEIKEPQSPESKDQPSDEDVDTKFNVNDIEKIEDAQAKELVQKMYKSFEKGYQEKFQDVAKEKRDLEMIREEVGKWTPQKVQELLNNQAFKDSAQQVMQMENPTKGVVPDDEWSNLSDSDKVQMSALQQKIDNLEKTNQQEKIQAILAKQDTELSSKYGNYDSIKVNEIRQNMLNGKQAATNEHLYKAFYHDENVKRAYEQGKQDASSGNMEKVNASTYSTDASSTVPANAKIERNEGETSQNYLTRIFHEKFKQRQNIKK